MKNEENKEVKKTNNEFLEVELERVEKALETTSIEDDLYGRLLKRRQELKDQLDKKVKITETKGFEYAMKYGLPVIGTTAVTMAYMAQQDPSNDGRTWFQCLKDFFKFK